MELNKKFREYRRFIKYFCPELSVNEAYEIIHSTQPWIRETATVMVKESRAIKSLYDLSKLVNLKFFDKEDSIGFYYIEREIVLNEVPIPDVKVVFYYDKRFGKKHKHELLIRFLDAETDAPSGHPHVSDLGSLCYGNMDSFMTDAAERLDFITMYHLIHQLLYVYNPSSCFRLLEGASEYDDDDLNNLCCLCENNDATETCYACDSNMCSNCVRVCSSCENYACPGHVDTCSVCQNDFCQNCVSYCSACNGVICENPDCSSSCPVCNTKYCRNCMDSAITIYECEKCHKTFCMNCNPPAEDSRICVLCETGIQ